MQKSKIWTRNFILLFAANFFMALTFYILMTTMALYALNQLNSSQSEAGLASSIFVIGALFARLLAGKYTDVIGRKIMLITSLVTFLIATVLYFPVSSITFLLIVRFIHGFAFGIANTIVTTIAIESLPLNRCGEGTSYYSLSPTAATAIGPFIGVLLTQNFSFHVMFITCTVINLLAAIVIFFVRIKETEWDAAHLAEIKRGFKIGDFFEKKALPISLMMLFIGIGYSSIVSFINTYAIEVGLTSAAAYFFIIYSVFLFISRPVTGRLLDTKGENIVIYPAIILFSVCLTLIGIAQSGITLLLAGVLLALGFGTLMSSGQVIATKAAPKNHIALATSTYFICMDSGTGIGPYLIGLIIPFTGYRTMYIIIAIIVFCMLIFYYLIHGRKAAIHETIKTAE